MAPKFFQHTNDMMRREGHSVIHYIDDCIGSGVAADTKCSYDHLYDLLERLGLTISHKKLVPHSTSAVCLVVDINTENASTKTASNL